MMLDYMTCPKCGSPVGMKLEPDGYEQERDRVAMKCSACACRILVKPLDHPDRLFLARLRQRVKRWFSA
jgi:DNA-directed RNA polymerase subunit RPC12/RpoP